MRREDLLAAVEREAAAFTAVLGTADLAASGAGLDDVALSGDVAAARAVLSAPLTP